MSTRILCGLWAALTISFSIHAQDQRRFRDEVFPRFDSVVNITYGRAVNLKGEMEELQLDMFSPPAGDTLKKRPVLVFIHGGGFVNGNRKITMGRKICETFARKGFVTVSISYRLGIGGNKTNNDYLDAMYRAQQDGRGAIRYLRSRAAEFGIDTTQVFVTGTSAGAMTSLGLAYMDEHEVPAGVDKNKWGSLEGNSGPAGYSSKVQGVINCWGALPDTAWIDEGDVPLFNTGGTADKTVPYDNSYSYHGIGFGPLPLYERCLKMGVTTGLRPFEGAGHTLDNDKKKIDSCLREIGTWLYARLKIHGSSQGVRRWDKDIAAFDSLNRVQTYQPGSVLFMGSSYIRMWTNIRKDLRQPNIIHRGFGGCNLADVAYYAERIVFPHKPKALFMYVGNDITDGERDKSPEQVLQLFKYVVRTLRQRYPDMPITWLEISPSERRWGAWDRVQEANRMVREYCKATPGLHSINFSSHFLGKDGTPRKELYLSDKLHYNEEGYHHWGRAIRKEVGSIIKQAPKGK